MVAVVTCWIGGIHRDVSRVRVRVKEALDEDLLQVALDRVPRDHRWIHSLGDQRLLVGHLDPRSVFQCQNLLRGKGPVNLGHLNPRQIREVRSEPVSVLPLELVVDLLVQDSDLGEFQIPRVSETDSKKKEMASVLVPSPRSHQRADSFP